MKQNIGICKSLEEFCLKKLKCQNKCKKMKKSCEKNLSSGCGEKKVIKNQKVKKAPEVKKASIKLLEVKKASIKKQEEVKKASIKKQEEVKKASIKLPDVKKASIKLPEVKKASIKKQEEVEVKKASVKLQEDINAISVKNEISKKEERYVQKVFKNLGVDYKNCDSLVDYKEMLRKKCIKFLGYQSDTKKQEGCIATRFKWLMEANPDLEKSLSTLGCKIPV